MNIFKSLFGSSSDTLNPADVKARLDAPQPPFILDVRQPDEFKGGHIAGAKLIPLSELQSRLAELPADREIVCVCRSGSRSGVATSQLNRAGYTALNLRGGMMGWQMAGLPVKKGK